MSERNRHRNDKKNDDATTFKKQILLKEYEMLRQLMEKHDNQITQIRAVFLGFLGTPRTIPRLVSSIKILLFTVSLLNIHW